MTLRNIAFHPPACLETFLLSGTDTHNFTLSILCSCLFCPVPRDLPRGQGLFEAIIILVAGGLPRGIQRRSSIAYRWDRPCHDCAIPYSESCQTQLENGLSQSGEWKAEAHQHILSKTCRRSSSSSPWLVTLGILDHLSHARLSNFLDTL